MKRINESGQTLVEAIIVIGMAMLLVTGLISGTTASLSTAREGRSRSQATKLAQEGIEAIRSIRDDSWTTFSEYDGFYCFGEQSDFIPSETDSCTPNITTEQNSFTREVTFEPLVDKIRVTVSVSYYETNEKKSVELVTYFTDWK